MSETNSHRAGLFSLVRKLAVTGMSALHNRGELFLVELQEEKNRLIELFLWVVIVACLGMMFLLVLTATVILAFPHDLRVYPAAAFCILYLAGAVLALFNLRALWRNGPPAFRDTIAEAKKDGEWLGS